MWAARCVARALAPSRVCFSRCCSSTSLLSHSSTALGSARRQSQIRAHRARAWSRGERSTDPCPDRQTPPQRTETPIIQPAQSVSGICRLVPRACDHCHELCVASCDVSCDVPWPVSRVWRSGCGRAVAKRWEVGACTALCLAMCARRSRTEIGVGRRSRTPRVGLVTPFGIAYYATYMLVATSYKLKPDPAMMNEV